MLCDSEDRGLAWSFDEEIFEFLSQIRIYSQMHVFGLNLKRISNPSLAAIVTSLSSVPVFRQGNYNEPFVFNRLFTLNLLMISKIKIVNFT